MCARSGWFGFVLINFDIFFKLLVHLLYVILYMDYNCRKNEQIKVLKSVIISSSVLLNYAFFLEKSRYEWQKVKAG